MIKEIIQEALRKMSDEKIDTFIQNEWDGDAITFKYNADAAHEFAKIFSNVIITKDKKFMHIPGDLEEKESEFEEIVKKYKLGEKL